MLSSAFEQPGPGVSAPAARKPLCSAGAGALADRTARPAAKAEACPLRSSSLVRRCDAPGSSSCLASSTQQMNSLRASGVMSFQAWERRLVSEQRAAQIGRKLVHDTAGELLEPLTLLTVAGPGSEAAACVSPRRWTPGRCRFHRFAAGVDGRREPEQSTASSALHMAGLHRCGPAQPWRPDPGSCCPSRRRGRARPHLPVDVGLQARLLDPRPVHRFTRV